jgi:ribosomal protein S18 acetylase RimI-like enzyme
MSAQQQASVQVRDARSEDLPAIVALLADDFLGRQREQAVGPVHENYAMAFRAIEMDPNNQLLVAVLDDAVVATLQLTFTPSLSYRGSWRATVESVRTASPLRGRGIGAALMRAAIERARERGCALVQLSTNKARGDARRFYERLGFSATHEGMKLTLT